MAIEKVEEEMKEKELNPKKKSLKRVLAARLVIFAAATVWVVGWLMFGLGLIKTLFPPVWEGNIASAHPMQAFVFFWFIITFVIVGVWAAVKAFRFVGRWEKQ